jgi:hypothetical protein
MRLRSPCRDDAPLVIIFVRVDHYDFQAVHETNGVDSNLAVVETIVDLLDGRPLENPPSVVEGNSVPRDVAAVFPLILAIAHPMYLHNVNIRANGFGAYHQAVSVAPEQTFASGSSREKI